MTDVYAFLVQRLPTLYRVLAHGHERFAVRGGEQLVEGSVVDCVERARNHEVHHTYVVERLVPGRLIRYASTPSNTWVDLGRRRIEGTSNTFVEYRLEPLAADATHLDMTIAIQFPGLLQKLLALLFGRVRAVWAAHQDEELHKLTALVEAEAISPRAAPL